MAMPLPLPDPTPEPGLYDERGVEPIGPMTPEEYDVFEAASDMRHEYVDGFAYAMSGGTIGHSDIGFNVAVALRGLTSGSGCRVYAQNLRLLTPSGNQYYPDAMLQCGVRPELDAVRVESACLLVEVLSPSTRRVDLRDKLAAYQELPTLQAYWAVETTWRCVHRYWRDAGGRWRREDVTGDAVLPVPCLDAATLALDVVYEDVDVPYEPPRPKFRRVREPDAEYGFGDDELGEDAADPVDAAPAHGD